MGIVEFGEVVRDAARVVRCLVREQRPTVFAQVERVEVPAGGGEVVGVRVPGQMEAVFERIAKESTRRWAITLVRGGQTVTVQFSG